MSSVTLKHIYKVYQGGVRAVNDFNLEIKDKEFVVFVGPSGCGKSTTLRMIAGIEDITSGQLYIDQALVNDVDSKDRDIAMVFQNYALYPHMTVYQNMAFGLKLRHTDTKTIDERVKKAAEILEISELLNRKPKELSGGQRQRVALGRAIVRNPNVFLLDEPLSNLDAKLRVQMRTEITKLHENLQTTFIYVTHDQTEAMTMGDRIVVMKDGFIQQADTPITLFEDPQNLFVATFLGSPQMNVLDIKLVNDGNKIKALINNLESLSIDLPDSVSKQLVHSSYDLTREVLLGVRPEHISIGKEGLKAHIDVIEQLGDGTILYCKIEGREKYIVIKTALTGEYKAGDEVNLALDLNHLYMFDKENEQSIIGIPSFNKFKCEIKDNKVSFGDNELDMDSDFFSHLLDYSNIPSLFVGFKPEDVSINEVVGSHSITTKVDFTIFKTNYQVVYSLVKDSNKYLVYRAPIDKEIKQGDEVTVYVSNDGIKIYEENGNLISSREEIIDNIAYVDVINKDKNMIIKFSDGETLTYPSREEISDGKYRFRLKQNGQRIIYTKKMNKALKRVENPYNVKQVLDVSCYDEEPNGTKNIIFAQIKGFENYVTLVNDNNFSVYKMPKFQIEVGEDGFELIK